MLRFEIILFFSWLFVGLQAQPYVVNSNLMSHVNYLTSDSLGGRLTGSCGEKLAADYLVSKLKEFGLTTVNGTMTQSFSYVYRFDPKTQPERDTLTIQGVNVLAFLNNNADKTILIGAHYDHLGRNERKKSLGAINNSNIHPGADDNASGVAGVLELARMLTENDIVESSNFIIAFFSGEEDGIVGSLKLADQLGKSSINLSLMINLDMIGRLDSLKQLYVGGVGTSPGFATLPFKNNTFDLTIHTDSSGMGASDHNSFYMHNIPVLFFHTGAHVDYHKPTDTPDKINYNGMKQVVGFVYEVIQDLALKTSIPFTKTKNRSQERATMKVSLGIMPRHMDNGFTGLMIDGLTEGKPAERSGMQKGDIILQIGECLVNDIYSYMECLSVLSKNEVVKIQILRDGIKQTIEVTL